MSKCPHCKGEGGWGAEPGLITEKCVWCDGTGKVCPACNGKGGFGPKGGTITEKCLECHGTGNFQVKKVCPVCNGKGGFGPKGGTITEKCLECNGTGKLQIKPFYKKELKDVLAPQIASRLVEEIQNARDKHPQFAGSHDGAAALLESEFLEWKSQAMLVGFFRAEDEHFTGESPDHRHGRAEAEAWHMVVVALRYLAREYE